ncbi:MAG: hypothetical protein JNM69_02400 [Archangium sp.]|nr:hypothetical protein [Archangium sp.]
MEPRRIRIFISSPGDVSEEREKARDVIAQLQRAYGADRLQLEPVLWEDLPIQLDTPFPQGIEAVLSASIGIDIAVFILWSRLGSPHQVAALLPVHLCRLRAPFPELGLLLSFRCEQRERLRQSRRPGCAGRVSVLLLNATRDYLCGLLVLTACAQALTLSAPKVHVDEPRLAALVEPHQRPPFFALVRG